MKFKNKIFYGWVITAAFFVIGTAVWGIRFSYGVFFKSIESEFELSRAATSSVFSTHMGLGILFAIMGGWALDRFGPKIVNLIMGILITLSLLLTSQITGLWQLFITYGVLLSAGASVNYVIIISTVSRWFNKKRGMALGIASSGVGLGTVIMAPLATFLITTLNWRMAFLVIGVICLVLIIPLSWLLKGEPREIGALPDGEEPNSPDPLPTIQGAMKQNAQTYEPSLSQSIKTRSFWLITFIYFAIAFSMFLISTHLVPHATDTGISLTAAAGIMSLQGGAIFLGRIFIGSVSDKIGRKAGIIICTLLEAGALVWLIWAKGLWMFYLFAFAFGFAYGGIGPCIAAVAGEIFGLRRIGTLMGLLDIGFGLGAAVGPIIGGLIFDVSQSYSLAFVLAAVTMLISALFTTRVKREIKEKHT